MTTLWEELLTRFTIPTRCIVSICKFRYEYSRLAFDGKIMVLSELVVPGHCWSSACDVSCQTHTIRANGKFEFLFKCIKYHLESCLSIYNKCDLWIAIFACAKFLSKILVTMSMFVVF